MSTNLPKPDLWNLDVDWNEPIFVSLHTAPKPWAASITGLHISEHTHGRVVVDTITETPTADEIAADAKLGQPG